MMICIIMEKSRMILTNDENLMYSVSEMYYELGLGQAEIGRRLALNTMAVSRILKAAREKGIVSITIRNRLPRIPELEKELEGKYKLYKAIVISADEQNYIDMLPLATAQYIQMLFKPDMIFGIGVGPTISKILPHLYSPKIPGLIVVQMAGGYHETGDIYSHDIVRNISGILSAKGIYFHAPSFFKNEEIKKIALRDVVNDDIMQYWNRCELALVSANPLQKTSMLIQTGFITLKDMKELHKEGVVGSFLGNFYNIEGQFLDHSLNRRVASIPMDMLRKIPNVVVLSRYKYREKALLGAIRTGIVKTLIVDSETALKLSGLSD